MGRLFRVEPPHRRALPVATLASELAASRHATRSFEQQTSPAMQDGLPPAAQRLRRCSEHAQNLPSSLASRTSIL